MRNNESKTRDEKRLIDAGWKRRKGGMWKSPYTKDLIPEEWAVRCETFLETIKKTL